MGQKKSKSQNSYKFFGILFLLIMALVVINNMRKTDKILLSVINNNGVSFLETAGDSLACVFKNGQVAAWNWSGLPEQKADFDIRTDKVMLLDAEHLAAVSETDKKFLSMYTVPSGEKIKDISVGWNDQQIWPRTSFDKKVIALIRKNPADSAGKVLYEFLTVDIEKDLTGIPVPLTIQSDSEALVDYAVDGSGILYAVGSNSKVGRIAALNLETGKKQWDQTYTSAKEFCSITVSPDNQYLLAGNRNGILYEIDAATGDIIKEIHLLKEGETRPVTNDYSVLNLAFSPDGRYYAATINPPVYVLDVATDTVVHKFSPADRLVSKVAFSPDSQFIATSDIRQGFPIKVWPLPQDD